MLCCDVGYRVLNLFARVELEGDELRVFAVDEPRAHSFLKRQRIDFLDEDQFHVITVNRRKLRELVERHGAEFFLDQPVVYRQTAVEK